MMKASSSTGPHDEILKRDPELRSHLEKLGLNSLDEYTQWCAQHGFSERLNKHWHQRCNERFVAAQDVIRQRMSQKKAETRSPENVLDQLFGDPPDGLTLTQPHCLLLRKGVTTIVDDHTRESLRELIAHAHRHSSLISVRAGFPLLGDHAGNTLVGGLLELAKFHSDWIRPVTAWRPASHNVHRQFASLARHLLARYPIPHFLDSAWFRGPSDSAQQQRTWYVRLARGESPRALDFPIALSRRMAHHFLSAPSDCSIEAALKWAQIRAYGGDARLARQVLSSRIGADFQDNDFWETVIRWFARHPHVKPEQIGPLIDFIHSQKFDSHTILVSSAGVQPLASNFSMHGRTAASLLADMDRWHAQLRKEQQGPQLEWPASGIGSFHWIESDSLTDHSRCWTTIELLSRRDLFLEGQAMKHCVASYDQHCATGQTSIWSLGVERNTGRRQRVLTIEIANRSRIIRQIRGKANRAPRQKEAEIVRRWAIQERLTIKSTT
jgi:hypothetical protein